MSSARTPARNPLTAGFEETGRALAQIQLAALKEAKRDGWDEGVRLYAVHKDGEQLVGVMRRPLHDALNTNPYLEERARYIICAHLGCNRGSGRRANESGCDYCPAHRS